jgi:hypothetical protein
MRATLMRATLMRASLCPGAPISIPLWSTQLAGVSLMSFARLRSSGKLALATAPPLTPKQLKEWPTAPLPFRACGNIRTEIGAHITHLAELRSAKRERKRKGADGRVALVDRHETMGRASYGNTDSYAPKSSRLSEIAPRPQVDHILYNVYIMYV